MEHLSKPIEKGKRNLSLFCKEGLMSTAPYMLIRLVSLEKRARVIPRPSNSSV